MLHTYSMPRTFKRLNIPLPLQSSYLRHYALSNDYIFILPKVEWCIEGVFLELFNLITDSRVTDIALTSYLMLPSFHHIDDSLLSPSRGLRFHFVLENQIIRSHYLKIYLQELEQIKSFSRQKPKSQ